MDNSIIDANCRIREEPPDQPWVGWEKRLRTRLMKPLRKLLGKRKARANVFDGQVREIFQYLFRRHAARKVFKHILDSHPQPANAGLAATFAGFDRDESLVIHKETISIRCTTRNSATRMRFND